MGFKHQATLSVAPLPGPVSHLSWLIMWSYKHKLMIEGFIEFSCSRNAECKQLMTLEMSDNYLWPTHLTNMKLNHHDLICYATLIGSRNVNSIDLILYNIRNHRLCLKNPMTLFPPYNEPWLTKLLKLSHWAERTQATLFLMTKSWRWWGGIFENRQGKGQCLIVWDEL